MIAGNANEKKNPRPTEIKLDAFVCEITLQVLVGGYLTSVLLVYQLAF